MTDMPDFNNPPVPPQFSQEQIEKGVDEMNARVRRKAEAFLAGIEPQGGIVGVKVDDKILVPMDVIVNFVTGIAMQEMVGIRVDSMTISEGLLAIVDAARIQTGEIE